MSILFRFASGVLSVVFIEAVYILAVKMYNWILYRRWVKKSMNDILESWNRIREQILREDEN